MSKVAVLKTDPDTVVPDYGRLMDLADYKECLPKDKETLLKLNLSWSLYFPSCSTEPWQLDGVLAKMTSDGYDDLIPIENRTVVTDPWKGAKLNKWLPLIEKYGLKFTPLTEVEWVRYEPKMEMLAMHDIFPEGFTIPKFFEGRNILHLPTQKTHGHTMMTGAMKNAFGGLLTTKRHHSHRKIHEVLVDLLAIQKEIHTGLFAVMDGTVIGDGAGPRAMIPRVGNHILASEDQVAIDAISAKMMGYDPMKIDFIRIAHDRGLGVGDPDQIDIVGDDISKICYKCETKKSLVVWGDQLFRKGALKVFEPILFHTPLFWFCIQGSAVFHDYVWYPIIGQKRINEFAKTGWGKLFEKY
ncbi:DUF362 domain-containing protein [Candidatus Altiarchaeota archaeon]